MKELRPQRGDAVVPDVGGHEGGPPDAAAAPAVMPCSGLSPRPAALFPQSTMFPS